MKRVISLLLTVLMIASALCLTVGVSATEEKDLYASVLRFDNFKTNEDITGITTEGATLETVKETFPHDEENMFYEANDYIEYHLEVSGEGLHSITADASSIDFSERNVAYVVIDSTSDLSRLRVFPVTEGNVVGEETAFVEYNGVGYFKLSSPADIEGVKITVGEAGYGYNMTEIFFCANEYSAKYLVDNNVIPPTTDRKKLVVHTEGSYSAIDLNEYPESFDFIQTKWPNIVVDENDKLYILGDGGKRPQHDDFIDAAVLVTSEDGGHTYSEPRIIYNSMAGAAPTILYLGNGTLLATIGIGDPSGMVEDNFRRKPFLSNARGGYCENWMVDHFDSDGYAVGGLMGTYMDVLRYIYETDRGQYKNGNIVIRSDDYGETWNVEPYTFKGEEGVDYTTEMRELAERYNLCKLQDYPTFPVFTAHGPKALSDGTVMFLGHAISGVNKELPDGHMGAYVSYDEGVNWELRGEVPIPCTWSYGDFAEPDTCETKDGVLICGVRSFVVFNSFSYDKGRTWTTLAQTEMEGYPPGYTVLDNGNILCTTNWRWSGCYVFGYISDDGGRTWSERAIVAGPMGGHGYTDMGYPNSAELSTGTIVTCYYDTQSNIRTTNWTYELWDTTPNSWVKADEGWVYFDENGEQVSSTWVKEADGSYYIGIDGYMVSGISYRDNSKKYYLFDQSGKKVTKKGWNKVNDIWYYVQSDTSLKTSGWMKDSRGWCYLASNGAMVTGRTVKDTKGYCLLDNNGYWITKAGWQSVGGSWYYVEKSGYVKTSTWMKDSKGWCYLGTDGMMYKNQTVKDSKGYCLVDGSGYWVTKQGWKAIGSDWYYVQKGGYVKTNGWMNDSKGWCYLNNNGTMLKNIAVKDSKGWCLLDKNGYWQKSTSEPIFVNFFYGGGGTSAFYTIDKNGYLKLAEN